MSTVIESWHRLQRDRGFDALLDEKVVLHPPVVLTHQGGKATLSRVKPA